MSRLLLFLYLCCCCAFVFGQRADSARVDTAGLPDLYKYSIDKRTDLCILGGADGAYRIFGELGIGINSRGRVGYHPLAMAAYASCEARQDNSRTILGPKLGCWTSGGVMPISMGLSLIDYTDLHASSLQLRPEGGLGLGIFKVTYGYNWTLTNKKFSGYDKHIVSLAFMVPVKKLKETKVAADWNPAATERWRTQKKEVDRVDTFAMTNGAAIFVGAGGWRQSFAEIGIGVFANDSGYNGTNGLVYIGVERLLADRPVYGFKESIYFCNMKPFGVCGGIPFVYYTDFYSNSWVFRPEVGLHYKLAMLTYGYNLYLSRYKYSEVGHHRISLIWGIPVKKEREVHPVTTYRYRS